MVAALADIPRHDQRSAPRPALRLVEGPVPTHRPRRAPVARRRPSAVVLRRRRLAASLLVVSATVGLLFALQAALGGGGGGPLTTATASRGALRPAAAHAWVVQPGQTLWDIALAVHPHGDIRPYVDQLASQLHGRPLVAGARIAIP